TWNPQTSGTNGSLYGVSFTDANNGTAVGSTPYPVQNGLVLHTTDGGTTWIQQNSNTIFFLNGVSFVDANNGTVGGLNGVILHTTDGGNNWIPQESNTGNMVRGICLTDTGTGYAVGDNGMIMKIGETPIPVELVSFTSKVNEKDVVLSWRTATETNNYGFNVERMIDGNWGTLGFISGAGNSTSPRTYSFKDTKPLNGRSYYRLKQIDFDGTIKYSKIVEVNYNTTPINYDLSQNYPNPFNPTTKIKYSIPSDGFVSLNVYNVIGQKVAELVNREVKAGTYEVNFDATKLSSGVYYYKIEMNGFVSAKKMILLR
ncbi:MAG TPA: T9SS type A sorting domain-containing protein, partial [Ignavibacteriaceae bacterium]|nr:T9SS type A sorting domain-containing protein [Ignavibacteriaceae bacterium]